MNTNIRKRKMTLVRTCAVLLMLCLHAPLQAAAIVIISSSITVEGKAGANTYSGTNSGSTTGTNQDYGSTWSTWTASSSGSITTTGATLNAASNLHSGRGDDYLTAGYSQVSLTSVFQPLTPDITFKFTGSTGHHAFESWINYTLTNLTASTLIQSASWKYEAWLGWATPDILPHTSNLTLNPNHQYQLQLLARSAIGDMRAGHANLNLQIVPEPAPAGLLAIALAGMIFRRFR